jgi:L-fuconate dehydratase
MGNVGEIFTEFDVFDIRFPTSRELDGSDAMNPDPDYSVAYLTVHTSDGSTGNGFVFTIGRGTDAEVAAIRAVEGLVQGLSVDEALADMGTFAKRLTHDSQLRWLGPEKGIMHMAIGAVINAVWDLKAKRAGLPLWQLLSELSPQQIVDLVDFRHITDQLTPDEALQILEKSQKGREQRVQELLEFGFPAYTTAAGWLGYSDEKVTLLVEKALREGFTHLKIKVGSDIESDMRRVEMVRKLVGPDIKISIDANQAWDVDEAIANTDRLAVHNLFWVEEPTNPDDVLGFKAIADAVRPVRVATGEHASNRVMFKQFLASGSIDVCQIDACRVGGVNENIAIILLAAKFGVPVCPHAGGVGLCEIVQHLSMFDYVAVGASLEHRWVEYAPHLHEHFVHPARIENARFVTPRSPGASTQLHEDSIKEFVFPHGSAWSE